MMWGDIHPALAKKLEKFSEIRPVQKKALEAGLLERRNLLICTPTASGKTLVAELACINSILYGRGKAIYIVPLKALAAEKYKNFTNTYGDICRIAMSIGDYDTEDSHLSSHDMIITTSEKLDSLIRHSARWLAEIATIVVDEVHLLNDQTRGPTIEIVITMLKDIVPTAQVLALSATIGNPDDLAQWLCAELVFDTWRPVELRKGIYLQGGIEFFP